MKQNYVTDIVFARHVKAGQVLILENLYGNSYPFRVESATLGSSVQRDGYVVLKEVSNGRREYKYLDDAVEIIV